MTVPTKWTAARIKAIKGKSRIPCLTAYDCSTARLIDAAGIPLILVGDSLAMTMLGYANTLPVTLAEMLHHTAAVSRSVKSALVVADMPFMTYQVTPEQALANAGRFIKEGGAGAVKIEGGRLRTPTVEMLVQNGIPVLGHIGLQPQSIHAVGGYKVQGRGEESAHQLVEDARALVAAGVFALVIECIPPEVARTITAAVEVPTIGIGAGPQCDGQILVTHDMLGLLMGNSPKFVKRYAELGQEMKRAFAAYRDDVEQGQFPAAEHTYSP